MDLEVKIPLLHDMFDLLNLPDGRNFPDSAVPSILESTNQLCAKIMDALKGKSSHICALISIYLIMEAKVKLLLVYYKTRNITFNPQLQPNQPKKRKYLIR